MALLDNLKNLFDTANEFEILAGKLTEEAKNTGKSYYKLKLSELPSHPEVSKLQDRQKAQFLLYLISQKHKENTSQKTDYMCAHVFDEAIKALVRSKIFFEDSEITAVVMAFITNTRHGLGAFHYWPVYQFISQIAKQREQNPATLSQELKTALHNLKINTSTCEYESKETDKLVAKIDELLFISQNEKGAIKPVIFLGKDHFSAYANPQIDALPEIEKEIWYRIIGTAQKASGGKPTAKFLSEAKKIIAEIGAEKFAHTIKDWFDFIVKNKDEVTNQSMILIISSINSEAVKGLVWMASQISTTQMMQTLGALSERSFYKIPQYGSPYVSVGNACLFSLYKSGNLDGIGHLSRLKLRIKLSSTLKIIEKYIEEAAKDQGMTVYEIEDLAVSDFGLANGIRTWEFNDYKAELSISGVGKTETKWIKPDGALQKTVPVFVKEKLGENYKDLKNTTKQVEVMVSAQRDRIDRMLRSDRKMSWDHFEKYYLNHGLMSYLSKKIIWDFTGNGKSETAIFDNGQWTSNQNVTITPTPNTLVSLWHPAISNVATITAWRDFLIQNKMVQPIKQAFREVYLLTHAEANTKSYSNRMAAHILKQHQFSMLAKTRGWKYALLGCFDNGRENGMAEIILNEYGLQAEYWVNEVNTEDAYNDTGIWNYVATDQVRFTRIENGATVDLVDVPAKPFSEIMRDVDLFVGVSSVGNDPTWQDTGGVPAFRDYWQTYSFGDLSEMAKMRKDILTNLVPRLKISKVAEIKDKFLVVRGKLRTYKIHIGSTNILMEPNDQYLCIVQDRKTKDVTENLYLPFEDDNGLSIVLSKAFLLADDDKITDPTIISQIKIK